MKRFLSLFIGLLLWLSTTACEVATLQNIRQEVIVRDFTQERIFELDPPKSKPIFSISFTINGVISNDVTLVFNEQDNNGKWTKLNEIPLPKGTHSSRSSRFDHYSNNRIQLIINAPRTTTGNLTINWGV